MGQSLSATAADWLDGRRLRAWELAAQGWSQRQIAAALGVTSGAVCQWMRRVREGGGPEALKKRKAPGGQPRLSGEQQAQILEWLREGAEAPRLFRRTLDPKTRGRADRAKARHPLSSRACQQAAPEVGLEFAEAREAGKAAR